MATAWEQNSIIRDVLRNLLYVTGDLVNHRYNGEVPSALPRGCKSVSNRTDMLVDRN